MRASVDLLVAGASGLVGRELVAQASAAGDSVCALVRRVPQAKPAGVDWRVVDFAALPALPQARSACCALGTTIEVAGSRAAFRAVDFDAVLAFARAALAGGCRSLAVVSALGADAASSNFYSRTKGEMEAAVAGLGFEHLVIARPSLLDGDRASLGQPLRGGERLALTLSAPLKALLPLAWRPIEAATVARAMRRALLSGDTGRVVLDSARLQQIGA